MPTAPVNPWSVLNRKPKKPKRGGRKPASSSGSGNAWTAYVGKGK